MTNKEIRNLEEEFGKLDAIKKDPKLKKDLRETMESLKDKQEEQDKRYAIREKELHDAFWKPIAITLIICACICFCLKCTNIVDVKKLHCSGRNNGKVVCFSECINKNNVQEGEYVVTTPNGKKLKMTIECCL